MSDLGITAPRRHLLETRHGNMHVRVWAAEPADAGATPLVLLHMSPLSSRMFLTIAPILARKRPVIVPDRLGFGDSDCLVGPLVFEEYALATLDALDGLDVGSFDVFGIHTGSCEAIELAVANPERVRRMGVVALPVFTDEELVSFKEEYFEPAADGSHLEWVWKWWKLWQEKQADWTIELMHERVVDHMDSWPYFWWTYHSVRILIATRRSAVNSRRVALQQLRAFPVTAPDPLRRELSQLTEARLLARCARLRIHASHHRARRALILALRTCAQRALQGRDETDVLSKETTALVDELAPGLRDELGVGPISAAQLLIAWSHPGRIRSEAAFARIAGVAPIPATSGQQIRHRLDCGGDRQLNRALHTIVLSRRQSHHPATIAYIERRTAEGRLLLPSHHSRVGLQSPQTQPPAHPPLPPTHQRQSRALYPHHARRLGLRRHLRQLTRTPPSSARLARLLQSPPTTRLPRPPTAHTTAGGAHQEQPRYVLQLGVEERHEVFEHDPGVLGQPGGELQDILEVVQLGDRRLWRKRRDGSQRLLDQVVVRREHHERLRHLRDQITGRVLDRRVVGPPELRQRRQVLLHPRVGQGRVV